MGETPMVTAAEAARLQRAAYERGAADMGRQCDMSRERFVRFADGSHHRIRTAAKMLFPLPQGGQPRVVTAEEREARYTDTAWRCVGGKVEWRYVGEKVDWRYVRNTKWEPLDIPCLYITPARARALLDVMEHPTEWVDAEA